MANLEVVGMWDRWLLSLVENNDPRLTCGHPYIYELGDGETATGWCANCRALAVEAEENGEMGRVMEKKVIETLMWCMGRIEGALGSVDQSAQHKQEALIAVLEKLRELLDERV